MKGLLVLVATVVVVAALPPPLVDFGDDDIEFKFEPVESQKQNDTYSGFRRVWIDQRGREFNRKYRYCLEVAFTNGVSGTAQQKSLYILKRMLWYMPPAIYNVLACRAKAGVFTRFEKISTFPEYQQHRDTPACRGRCNYECRITCTGDGRKYDSLAGVGGVRGVAVDDNIMCNGRDPYRREMNVLVHEFAHTIHQYSLSEDLKYQIQSAYNNARARGTWRAGSYAMSNVLEYFAEAAGVFFHTDKFLNANGGMSNCFNKGYCSNEFDARRWLQYKDPSLFAALNYIFTGNSGRGVSFPGPCV